MKTLDSGSIVDKGVLHLSIVGCDPFLVGLLLAVPLKSKLISIVYARGLLTHNGQNINNDAPDRPSPPPSRWRQNKPWDANGDCRPREYRSVAASDGRG